MGAPHSSYAPSWSCIYESYQGFRIERQSPNATILRGKSSRKSLRLVIETARSISTVSDVLYSFPHPPLPSKTLSKFPSQRSPSHPPPPPHDCRVLQMLIGSHPCLAPPLFGINIRVRTRPVAHTHNYSPQDRPVRLLSRHVHSVPDVPQEVGIRVGSHPSWIGKELPPGHHRLSPGSSLRRSGTVSLFQ